MIVISPIRINVAWRYIYHVITRDIGHLRVLCAFDSAGDVGGVSMLIDHLSAFVAIRMKTQTEHLYLPSAIGYSY